MGRKSFAALLEAQPPAPCERYACGKWRFCADDLLACSSFRWYVTSGRSVSPLVHISVKENRIVRSDTVAPEPDNDTYRLAMAGTDWVNRGRKGKWKP